MIMRTIDTPAWIDGIEIFSASPEWGESRVRCKMVSAERPVRFLTDMKLSTASEERESIATAFREPLANTNEHGTRAGEFGILLARKLIEWLTTNVTTRSH
jgi:hypothetical protein